MLSHLSRHYWHDLHSSSTPGEMPRAASRSLHNFVDITKAFDTVSREGLWKIMEQFGCPYKLIAIVLSFHNGM